MNNRTRFERFLLRNRDKGIPNLMLIICIASGILYLVSMLNNSSFYSYLYFDKAAILRGEVWRLVTYVFTYAPGSNAFLVLIGLYFFYHLATHVENSMGRFKFNLFYFTGVILMDIFAMIFCPTEPVVLAEGLLPPEFFVTYIYADMAWYLHLSLILIFTVTNPDAQFLVFFVIPVKAWFLALLDLVFIAIGIYNLSVPYMLFPHNLFPLVGLTNFVIFAGRDIVNLLPPALRYKRVRTRKAPQKPKTGSIPFRQTNHQSQPNYTHCCTVCGRTDKTNPELEFRYCSRCMGYHCYCQDHINNHEHIQ